MLLSAAAKLCVLGIQELVQVSAGDMTSVEALTYGLSGGTVQHWAMNSSSSKHTCVSKMFCISILF